jgi:allantoicase
MYTLNPPANDVSWKVRWDSMVGYFHPDGGEVKFRLYGREIAPTFF